MEENCSNQVSLTLDKIFLEDPKGHVIKEYGHLVYLTI
jgi:hypothetical protein